MFIINFTDPVEIVTLPVHVPAYDYPSDVTTAGKLNFDIVSVVVITAVAVLIVMIILVVIVMAIVAAVLRYKIAQSRNKPSR